MKIREYSLLPYSLKFKTPFIYSSKIISERNGFIIKVKNEKGKIGIGDCSPFPELNNESIEDTENELRKFSIYFKNDFDFKAANELSNYLSLVKDYPSVKAGLEQAFLSLLSKHDNFSLTSFFKVNQDKNIFVNSVIGICSIDDTINLLKKNIASGFQTIKLKIGRDNFDDDFNVISTVRKNIPRQTKLRLDVNSKWNKQEAVQNLKAIESFSIEYVEQPTKNILDFPDIQKEISIPLAADESIKSLDDAVNIINNKLASVIIIKPLVIGGIADSIQIIKLAEKKNIKTIITTSFDSSVGKRISVFLSSILKNKTACGLATSKFFIKDINRDLYPVKNGKISFQKFII